MSLTCYLLKKSKEKLFDAFMSSRLLLLLCEVFRAFSGLSGAAQQGVSQKTIFSPTAFRRPAGLVQSSWCCSVCVFEYMCLWMVGSQEVGGWGKTYLFKWISVFCNDVLGQENQWLDFYTPTLWGIQHNIWF